MAKDNSTGNLFDVLRQWLLFCLTTTCGAGLDVGRLAGIRRNGGLCTSSPLTTHHRNTGDRRAFVGCAIGRVSGDADRTVGRNAGGYVAKQADAEAWERITK